MSDPIGVELSKWTQPNGLNISEFQFHWGNWYYLRIRPNVTIDAVAYALNLETQQYLEVDLTRLILLKIS